MTKPKKRKKAVAGVGKVTRRRKTTRRRGVGSIDIEQIGMKVLALGGGAIAARLLNTMMVKQFPTLSPIISGAIQIAAGVAIPMFVKAPVMANVGNGMIANGVMVEAVNFGIISGIGATPRTMQYRVSGTSQMSAVGAQRRRKMIGNTSQLSAVGNTSQLSAVGDTAIRQISGGAIRQVNGPAIRQVNGIPRQRF